MTSSAEAPIIIVSSGSASSWRHLPTWFVRGAYAALVVVLVSLSVFALWAAFTTHQAAEEATHASILSDQYQQARYWIGAEESLERKYRLEGGADVLAAHHAAAHALENILAAIARDGDAPDRALAAVIMVKHHAYLEATWHGMFPAVDAHNTARVIYFDHGVVDPVFSYIQDHMFAASDVEHGEALAALRVLDKTQNWVLSATPIIFLLGVVLLLAIWGVLRLYQHRIDEGITRDAQREVERVREAAEAEQRALAQTAAAERSALQRSEARLRALVQNASDIIAVIDAEGVLCYLSDTIETVLALPAATLLGTPVYGLVHRDDEVRLQQVHAELVGIAGARVTIEARLRHGDGSWRSAELISTNLTDDPDISGIVINARDVTERKIFEAQLQHQAFHDPLTGLPNRTLFLDRVEHALARVTRHNGTAAILFLDLDRFKVVNDSLGHAAGDLLLVAVAERLKACLQEEDTVARIGGDEFALLLGELPHHTDALRIAERIIHALDKPFHLEGHDVVTATSIGIVTSGPNGSAADLLRDADVALYRAKARGRGRYEIFDATMNSKALERLELEEELRQALERGEFLAYYQPKVELGTGRFVGMEALLRWQSPRRGLVSPLDFIPLAEETGLIRPLGQWILEEACRQTVRWNADRTAVDAIVVSVNLSACQFTQSTLVEDVARALRESGVAPGHIQLEITESVAMGDAEATVQTLEQLKILGVKLALDDFGTGYSSLAYLKRFPVDTLKIDRSFVSGLVREGEDASIINAVVSLGRALKLSVVAEGVETADESAQVRELGCALGQGYYWAKPLPLEHADLFIGQRREQAA